MFPGFAARSRPNNARSCGRQEEERRCTVWQHTFDETILKQELGCVVCLGPALPFTVIAPCGHVLCKECIDKLTNDHANDDVNRCPSCRGDVVMTAVVSAMTELVEEFVEYECLRVGCDFKGKSKDSKEHRCGKPLPDGHMCPCTCEVASNDSNDKLELLESLERHQQQQQQHLLHHRRNNNVTTVPLVAAIHRRFSQPHINNSDSAYDDSHSTEEDDYGSAEDSDDEYELQEGVQVMSRQVGTHDPYGGTDAQVLYGRNGGPRVDFGMSRLQHHHHHQAAALWPGDLDSQLDRMWWELQGGTTPMGPQIGHHHRHRHHHLHHRFHTQQQRQLASNFSGAPQHRSVRVSGELIPIALLAPNPARAFLEAHPGGSRFWCRFRGHPGHNVLECHFAHSVEELVSSSLSATDW